MMMMMVLLMHATKTTTKKKKKKKKKRLVQEPVLCNRKQPLAVLQRHRRKHIAVLSASFENNTSNLFVVDLVVSRSASRARTAGK